MSDLQLAPPFPSSRGFPVEVKEAGGKGRGAFATRDVRRGQVCCWYDGIIADSCYKATLATGDFGYCLATENETYIAGFRAQLREGGCAQLCNDASTTYTDQSDLKYLKHINVKIEAYANGDGIAFIATKPIKKGEELLFSYGPGYWKTKREREGSTEQNIARSVSDIFQWAAREALRAVSASEGEDAAKRVGAILRPYTTEGDRQEQYELRLRIATLLSKFVNQISEADGNAQVTLASPEFDTLPGRLECSSALHRCGESRERESVCVC